MPHHSNEPVINVGSPTMRNLVVASYGELMNRMTLCVIAAFCLFIPSMLNAQAPSGATGQCKDGTYSTATSKSGACRGHKGVQSWYTPALTVPQAKSAQPAAQTASVTSNAAPAATAITRANTPPASAPTPRPSQAASPSQPAAGGGGGQVWVNTATQVYHCSGDRFYGKTKKGAYMSESDAVAKGARPDAGKACSK